jgi:ubiquinone/menaquinone biosynthesis C-methylase UbiE
VEQFLDATFEAEQDHFWFRGLTRFSAPLLEMALAGRQAPRILDCGFGTGANMARLARSGRTFGFDLAVAGARHARGRYGETRLAQASITSIPFASGTFDLVTAFDVLACLDEGDLPQALAEMHRVLKPGGALFLNTAALPLLRGSHAVFGLEVHRATRRPLKASLEAAGFRVVRLTYTNFSLFPLMVLVRLSQRLFGLSSPEESGMDIVVPPAIVNGPLSAMLAAESVALRVVNMPIGSSLLGLAFKAG